MLFSNLILFPKFIMNISKNSMLLKIAALSVIAIAGWMKNHTNSISVYLFALCAFALLLEAGCKTSVAPIMGGSNRISLTAQIAPNSILSRYDTSNLVGLIEPRNEIYHIITHVSSGQSNWSGTQSGGEAQFVDSNGNAFDIGAVVFNRQFPNIPSPSGSPTGSYAYIGDSLPIYTDGSTKNYVMVHAFNGANGSAFDSLTFGVVPSITNITFNQNLSRDSTITINWTGTSGDFVLASIYTWDSTGMTDTNGHTLSVGGYYNNTGSVTFPVNHQLVKGLADVEVLVYTPKFITLSNGKRVAVIVKTGEEITVHIVD
jgi:hypothetical protein